MDSAATVDWLPLLQIVWIDILLSGDNAVVIALACRSLPDRQRAIGIVLGSGAAIVLRVAFTLLVVELLGLPFVRMAGGALLLWIAIMLAGPGEQRKEIAPAKSLWSAIRIVAMADAAMSLDNMVAVAAAARGSKLLILFGLVLSIPLLVFGSAIVLLLLNRFPVLVWAGAVLLGWIAGDLFGSDPELAGWMRARWPGYDDWDGALGGALVPAASWLRRRLRAEAARP